MNTQKDFALLVNSGYFYNCIMSENQFIGTLTFSDIQILVRCIGTWGYRVFMQNPETGITMWRNLLDVADVLSVFGVVTDVEDLWLKALIKKEKEHKPILHSYAITA